MKKQEIEVKEAERRYTRERERGHDQMRQVIKRDNSLKTAGGGGQIKK